MMVRCRTWCMADTVFSQAICRGEETVSCHGAACRPCWPQPHHLRPGTPGAGSLSSPRPAGPCPPAAGPIHGRLSPDCASPPRPPDLRQAGGGLWRDRPRGSPQWVLVQSPEWTATKRLRGKRRLPRSARRGSAGAGHTSGTPLPLLDPGPSPKPEHGLGQPGSDISAGHQDAALAAAHGTGRPASAQDAGGREARQGSGRGGGGAKRQPCSAQTGADVQPGPGGDPRCPTKTESGDSIPDPNLETRPS